jgi:hypothetical protein
MIFDAPFAIKGRVQECLYFLAWEARLDEEIEKLQEPKLALVEVINIEQTLTVRAEPSEPSCPFSTVVTFHERQPSDSPVHAQLLRRGEDS